MTTRSSSLRRRVHSVVIVYLVLQLLAGTAWMGVALGIGSSLWHQAAAAALAALVTLPFAMSVQNRWPRQLYANTMLAAGTVTGYVILVVVSLAAAVFSVLIASGQIG
jgi:hypothetical protein